MKYNEIMENVKVTEEMRERILSNVSKETAKKEKRILAFPNWKILGSLVACAAIVLVCIATLPKTVEKNQTVDNTELTGVGGIVECDSIQELSENVGFEVKELSEIPFEIEDYAYTLWFDMAQVEYIGTKNTITYRVAEGNEDISGDYNEYSLVKEATIQNIKVTLKGDENQVYLAIWNSGKYAYAIGASEGITYQEMSEILEALLGDL